MLLHLRIFHEVQKLHAFHFLQLLLVFDLKTQKVGVNLLMFQAGLFDITSGKMADRGLQQVLL